MRKIKGVLRLRFELGWGSGPSPALVQSARARFMNISSEPRWPRSRGRCQKVGTKSEWKQHCLQSADSSSSFPNVCVLTFLLCMRSYNSIAI